MTAQILQILDYRGDTPVLFTAPQIVADARAVIRRPAAYSPQIVRDACEILKTWGDASDWLTADKTQIQMNRADRQPAPIRACHMFIALLVSFTFSGLIWADPIGAMSAIAADDLARSHYIAGVTP